MSFVNDGTEKYSNENCAYCTVAAIFGTTASQISRMLGLGGGVQAAGGFAYVEKKNLGITEKTEGKVELAYDFAGIKGFVRKLKAHVGTPVYVSQGGSWDTPVPLSTMITFMKTHPAGTQFAVWAYESTFKGMGAHWNYAEKKGNGVEFRDYQCNDAEDHPPVVSETFIPPRGGDPDFKDYQSSIVLVFRSKTTPLIGPK